MHLNRNKTLLGTSKHGPNVQMLDNIKSVLRRLSGLTVKHVKSAGRGWASCQATPPWHISSCVARWGARLNRVLEQEWGLAWQGAAQWWAWDLPPGRGWGRVEAYLPGSQMTRPPGHRLHVPLNHCWWAADHRRAQHWEESSVIAVLCCHPILVCRDPRISSSVIRVAAKVILVHCIHFQVWIWFWI